MSIQPPDTHRSEEQQFVARVIRPDSAERAVIEQELLNAGNSLPLQHRSFGARCQLVEQLAYISVHDDGGRPAFAFAIESARSRAIPGYRILRATRLGGSAPAGALRAGIAAASQFARTHPRVLRLHLEFFLPNPDRRREVEGACREESFARMAEPRCYRETILINLAGTAEDVFAGLSSTARRHCRAVQKNPVSLRPITDPSYTQRMNDLLRETLERSGSRPAVEDWGRIIAAAGTYPHDLRLVGLFDERPGSSGQLLAYALALNHGEFIEYATAASTRATDLRIPLAYGLVWHLMAWGIEEGARWFDFGGVTRGTAGDEDPLGGISDFKRYFSKNVVEVGSEWVLEPNPGRAAAARGVSRLSGWISAQLHSLRA